MVISFDYDDIYKENIMKTMGISEFKAHALKIINQISKTQEGIVITKRGKPLAEIFPYRNKEKNPTPGKLAGAFVLEKDIITPIGADMWESCK